MICYQDEKTYCDTMPQKTIKELDAEIKALELELYGEELPHDVSNAVHKVPTIFDVDLGKLVAR